MGSHSLRIGGATALYHTTDDLERVGCFGRWGWTSFHGYLGESHEHAKGLAGGMASGESKLLRSMKTSVAGDPASFRRAKNEVQEPR